MSYWSMLWSLLLLILLTYLIVVTVRNTEDIKKFKYCLSMNQGDTSDLKISVAELSTLVLENNLLVKGNATQAELDALASMKRQICATRVANEVRFLNPVRCYTNATNTILTNLNAEGNDDNCNYI